MLAKAARILPCAAQYIPIQGNSHNILHKLIQLQMAISLYIYIQMTQNKMVSKAQNV